MAASVPPAITTSARPARTASSARPMASVAEAQAVLIVCANPLACREIEMLPAASLEMSFGMVMADSRPGPRSAMVLYPSSQTSAPPMPLPSTTDTRSASQPPLSSPASAQAILAAETAYCVKRAMRRDSLASMCLVTSKFFTCAATRQSTRAGSKRVIVPMPLTLARMPAQNSPTVLPMGVTAPSPVTTTRFFPALI